MISNTLVSLLLVAIVIIFSCFVIKTIIQGDKNAKNFNNNGSKA